MGKYNELISDESVWLSATPTEAALSLPFHLTEAGHFFAETGYKVSRDSHASFLLLCTLRGTGRVRSAGREFDLPAGSACLIDCHAPHEYSCTAPWEFYWLHFDGASLSALSGLLFPEGPKAADMSDDKSFPELIRRCFALIPDSGIENSVKLSEIVHRLISKLGSAALDADRRAVRGNAQHDIETVIEYIDEKYGEQITIDDMTEMIHLSKYHFIRVFRRIMGVTPYSYLTNHRINRSKELLRSTDLSVAEIADRCGFLDSGNFIAQFKKRAGMTPARYRCDFS